MTCPRFLLTGSVGMGLAVAAGCTSSVNGTTSGTGGDTDVTGTTQTTYLTDTGDITGVPMASFTAAALVPAPGGGFDRVAGAYDAAEGTFVLHGVPEEPYYLETGAGSFVWTTARTFDLDQVLAGRPDAQTVTTSPTNLVIDASAMTPWQDGDELALFSLGANAFDIFSPDDAPMLATLAAGATSLQGFAVDMSKMFQPGLIDGSKGDKAVLTHLTLRTSGSMSYQAVAQAIALPSFTVVDGQPAPVSGTWVDVPQGPSIDVTWKRSAFAPMIAAANPAAVSNGYSISVYIEPAAPAGIPSTGTAVLLDLGDLASTDLPLTLAFGNPFPASYLVWTAVDVSYTLPLNVSGPAAQSLGSTWVAGPVAQVLQGTLVPGVSPPVGVTIGGKAATADLTGVGTSPVIAWSAPAMGTPTGYSVVINAFDSMGQTTAAYLTTTGTSVTVPPGLLTAGTQYAAVVEAFTGAYDPAAPYEGQEAVAGADALTGLFTP